MNCPNCQSVMDREDGAIIYENTEAIGLDARVREIPMSEYRCPDCDLLAKWRKDSGWEVLWDPKRENELEVVAWMD